MTRLISDHRKRVVSRTLEKSFFFMSRPKRARPIFLNNEDAEDSKEDLPNLLPAFPINSSSLTGAAPSSSYVINQIRALPVNANQNNTGNVNFAQSIANGLVRNSQISENLVIQSRMLVNLPPADFGNSLRQNYLTVPQITATYDAQYQNWLLQVPVQDFNRWIFNPQFYGGAITVARQFGENVQLRNRFLATIPNNIFNRGVAEFIQFLENHIQESIRQGVAELNPNDNLSVASYQYLNSFLSRDRQSVNNNLRELFYNYYRGNNLRGLNVARWNSSIRKIVDKVILKIKQVFAQRTQNSDLLQLLPRLTLQQSGIKTLYQLDADDPSLTLLFAISMIRFPTENFNRTNELVSFQFNFPIAFPGNVQENRSLRCERTSLTNQKLFYFIPDHQRIVGLWEPYSIVKNSANAPSIRYEWNYNVNLLRTCLIKVRIPTSIQNNTGGINFHILFPMNGAHLYDYVRRLNPFQINPLEDPLTRLYASLTIYVNENNSLLHIPWVLEGSLENPIPYDTSQFSHQWNQVLTESESGEDIYERSLFMSEFYFYFSFLRDPSLPIPALRRSARLQRNTSRARTPQQVSLTPPSPSIEGVLVGAPFVGTKKEKHYLLGSLINRFTVSNALFQTPERDLNTCLIMSFIKAQMINYYFENEKCTDIKYTDASFGRHRCDNIYVQSMYNFPDNNFPFLEKINQSWYIKLFNCVKHKDDIRFFAGCKSDEEINYWEMAAEEILFNLERHFERKIDYRNLSDMGQCFSTFFNVCISIYDVEMRANRVHLISPFQLTPTQLIKKDNKISMIHLVFDQGHIHAITNLQSFVRSKNRKENLRLYNYCPICDKKQSRDLCKGYEGTLIHITTCGKSTLFHTGFYEEEKKQSETNLSEIKLAFRKNSKNKNEAFYNCVHCHSEITQEKYIGHVCVIPTKKCENLMEEKIYVYDLECAQLVDELGLLKHECNCLYILQVYNEEKQGIYFPNEIEFIHEIISNPDYLNATFIAHNGGAYDIHFILRILEREEIDHTYVPSPTSKHKFIQIKLTEFNITFIDFMRFIPGSLKSIAEAFDITSGKGDFPHRFNNGKHDAYIGRLPCLFSDDDYWSLYSFRGEKEKKVFIEWYHTQEEIYCTCDSQCHCDKIKWSFQYEIKKYCLQDVIVLSEIAKKYRYQCMNFDTEVEQNEEFNLVKWKAPLLDPFQFMTLPQITMQTLIQGFQSHTIGYHFPGITSFNLRGRGGRCWEAILWLIRLQDLQSEIILHLGNCLKEYYHFDSNSFIDGWCPQTNVAYIFLKCSYWGCPKCMMEHHERNEIIPERNLYANEVMEAYEVWIHLLNKSFSDVKIIWQCDFNYQFLDPYMIKCCQLMNPKECFYGGRTEVFKMYANSDKLKEDIHYYDVTSLYPSVYAHHFLPLGVPRHLLGYLIDPARFHPTATNRYFGFARVSVIPQKNDLLGLLPQRCLETGRLSFPVLPMEGCWGTEEIYLAMQNGYKVEKIYEIYFWEENQRSNQHLRGYVDYFLRMKQEAEGWKKLGASSESPSDEEKKEIQEKVFVQNGHLGKIRIDKVEKNPVLRTLAKLYLNALWGKFAQKSSKTQHTTVYGTQQFLEIWHDKRIEQESCLFREISQGVYKVTYKLKDEFVHAVKHGNIFIAAKVTETARCVLHAQMIKIGPERIIYCDTDSIIFCYIESLGDLTGVGLGKWTNEYPTKKIKQVYALAPKLYSLMFEGESLNEVVKAKGIQMTLVNQEKMKFCHVQKLIEDFMEKKENGYTIQVNNFSIFTNSGNSALPYGSVYTRYNEKKVRAIITKRIVPLEKINWGNTSSIQTYPIGYELFN